MEQTLIQTIVENKCWIVTNQGKKIGTVMSIDTKGGVVFVQDGKREKFGSIASLMTKYNFNFKNSAQHTTELKNEFFLFGFPCSSEPFNSVIDARKKLPLYTTSKKSKKFHAAGYYYVKYKEVWHLEFCPKLLTLSRHEFIGPFATKLQANESKLEKK